MQVIVTDKGLIQGKNLRGVVWIQVKEVRQGNSLMEMKKVEDKND